LSRGKRLEIKPGERFGRFTIIREISKRNGRRYFWCKCDCGAEKAVRLYSLTSGKIISCGCYNREVSKLANSKHGLSNSRLYKIWIGMKNRCFNPNNTEYKNYGGRGIVVCQEWMQFEAFRDWAVANGYRDDLTIERINNDGNYELSNCTWITPAEQRRNTRKAQKIAFNGQKKTIRQWAKQIGIHSSTLCLRLKNGWDLETALTAPANSVPRRAAWK